MNEFIKMLIGLLGTILTGLISWLTTYLVSLISNKIKDEKLKTFLTNTTGIIMSSVNALNQTTVNELKREGKFDKEAAVRVKQECLKLIKSQLAPDMIKFIGQTFGDIDEYLSNQIEAYIFKNNQSK